MFVEVAGRPPEYVKNSLELHVKKIGEVKDVKLLSCKLAEPKKIEGGEDLHTCFAEVEVELLGLSKLLDLIFDFMPSSIEIVDPEYLEMGCQEATMFANDLAGRLHKYDDVAKMASMQVQQLTQKLQAMQQFVNLGQPKPSQSPYQPLKITMQPSEEKKSVSKKEKVVKPTRKKK